MLSSVEEAVEAVRRARAGRGRSLQPPCDPAEIARLRADSLARLGTEPPGRYLDLLRLTNGFWENGLHVYASRISDLVPPSTAAVNGFVEATRMYRENFSDYFARMLVFAEDDAYVYALDLASGRYVQQSYTDPTPSRTFDTFDGLFAHAVGQALI